MTSQILFNGRPVWVDVASDDPDATRAFYSGLLGWTFEVSGPEYGNYSRARVDGQDVAGVFPRPEGVPIAWTTYLYADDVDAFIAKAVTLGGTPAGEPFDVPMVGRMGVALDPNFAAFGLWRVDGMPAIDLQQRYGAVWWENWSSNAVGAVSFYRDLFGFETEKLPFPDMDYTLLKTDGRQVAAVGGMFPGATDAAHWAVYFSTHDVDAACAYTVEHGGSIDHAPEDSPYGRLASCTDPFGAAFKLMTPNMDMPGADTRAT